MTTASDIPVPIGADAPILQVMATMRAMRRLKPDPVPDDLLEQLVEAATWAPSGSNNQSYSFLVVTDRQQIRRLAPVWQRIAEWYIATQRPPSHMGQEKWERLTATLRYQADHFEETPALILACYDFTDLQRRLRANWAAVLRATARLGPRHAFMLLRNTPRLTSTGEAASIYPAVQNLLLAARAHGLGAVITTWHVLFEQEIKGILGIPSRVNVYAIVPVGWPKGKLGPVTRRPAREAIHRDRW
jgi:nitroreductase